MTKWGKFDESFFSQGFLAIVDFDGCFKQWMHLMLKAFVIGSCALRSLVTVLNHGYRCPRSHLVHGKSRQNQPRDVVKLLVEI